MAIVNRLFEVRTQRGLTQEEVAARTGVSRVTVGRVDRNPHYRPKGKTMQELARGLRLRIGDLFDDDEVMVDPEPEPARAPDHPFPSAAASDTAPPTASSAPARDLVRAGVTRVAVGAGSAKPTGRAGSD